MIHFALQCTHRHDAEKPDEVICAVHVPNRGPRPRRFEVIFELDFFRGVQKHSLQDSLEENLCFIESERSHLEWGAQTKWASSFLTSS